MTILCPSCGTKYKVPESVLASGKKIRCKKCNLIFKPENKKIDNKQLNIKKLSINDIHKDAEDVTVGNDENININITSSGKSKSSRELISKLSENELQELIEKKSGLKEKSPNAQRFIEIGAVLLVLFVISLIAVIIRVPLVKTFPDLAGIYHSVGLDVNIRGLIVEDVRLSHSVVQNLHVLNIKGRVRNIETDEVTVPKIKLSVKDIENNDLYSWVITPPVDTLKAGASDAFTAQLVDPPKGIVAIEATFLSENTF